MKKLKISLAGVVLLLVGILTVNGWANPLPSRRILRLGPVIPPEWIATNCSYWPKFDSFWVDPTKSLLSKIYDDYYADEVNEQYLAAQKEKYGRNIPYCLTEKAQDLVQQEIRAHEEYLQEKGNPNRDRLFMLAKIEEANAKTAKELGLENLYKPTPELQIDKATLDAWWEETHPNGKPLDAQAIAQRYKDYFAKREWKTAHPNEPEPSIEEIRTWKEQKKIQEEQKRQKIYSEMPKTIDLADFPSTEANETIKQTHINYLFAVGLVALGIVAGAAIILLKRRKNKPGK